ncbi:MAG: DUF2973 domain-containing protein [Phormidesmis sp.]
MLHLLYVIAFTVLAVIAVSNMLRNLVTLGTQSRQPTRSTSAANRPVPHPELLDDSGDVINEPLLVMRSINIKDARDQLDAMYNASSGSGEDASEES